MTALSDLQTYLTSTLASKIGDTVLSDVLTTEIADQAARIKPVYRMPDVSWWDDHLPPLREAVLRRCCRNLAMRKLPLGISEQEASAIHIGSSDPEIRRLEGPYRRMTVG